MRLNDGRPVWHASVSTWSPQTERKVDQPRLTENEAIRLLTGIGGDIEWWIHSDMLVGHLRVAVTTAEYERIPPGCAVADAGDSGPQRPRTRR